jgi:hypothetical protein
MNPSEPPVEEKTKNQKNLFIILIAAGAVILIGLLVFFVIPATSARSVPTATLITAATEAQPPTATSLPPTATPLPTATTLPSPTAVPPLALSDEGLTIWCYPTGLLTAPPSSAGLSRAPENANISSLEGEMVLLTIPNYSCNYVFHLNQKVPDGLKLEVYDWLQKLPIFNLALKPATDDPNAAVLVTTNAYLTSPPVWEYTYKLVLKDAAGAELWNGQVHMDKGWRPAICLAGVLPNPKTMRCPNRQDAHPWDAWYGKTPVPNDDEHPIP